MEPLSAHFEQEAPAELFVGEAPQTRRPVSLIDERFDHDSCGVGFVASVDAVSSHSILQNALTALSRLAHRGAVAADGKSSDGVGLMTAVPRGLLLGSTGLRLDKNQELGVGMLFLPEGESRAEAALV